MTVEASIPSAHFSRTFSAAHRVWNDESKCRNLHGHNYDVEIDVEVEGLNEQNFVAPFDAIKLVIDGFDHTMILDTDDPKIQEFSDLDLAIREVPGVPSTEFMAALLANRIAANVKDANPHAGEVKVSLHLTETKGISASAIAAAR